MPCSKANDARMLKKASHDTFHADIVRKAWHTRAQAANAAHHKINLHTGLACRRINYAGINQPN
jgi:hypothetical protein